MLEHSQLVFDMKMKSENFDKILPGKIESFLALLWGPGRPSEDTNGKLACLFIVRILLFPMLSKILLE